MRWVVQAVLAGQVIDMITVGVCKAHVRTSGLDSGIKCRWPMRHLLTLNSACSEEHIRLCLKYLGSVELHVFKSSSLTEPHASLPVLLRRSNRSIVHPGRLARI